MALEYARILKAICQHFPNTIAVLHPKFF